MAAYRLCADLVLTTSLLLTFTYSECPPNRFGPECLSHCSQNCEGGLCDSETGICTSGCVPGYQGDKCENECTEERYGKDCKRKCSKECISGVCFNVNGTCTNGCSAGYKGYKCNEECDFNKYGAKCSRLCHCRDQQERCNKVTGLCISGCAPGWMGGDCQIECDDYKFGENCSMECRCQDSMEVCSKTDGRCRSFCAAGWKGKDCQTDCSLTGHYGEGCIERCSNRCKDNLCNQVNGTCKIGCLPGYTGDRCTEECSEGRFGEGCIHKCSPNCANGLCNNYNGFCTEECNAGYQGNNCSQECKDFHFGLGCRKKCRCNDSNEICDKKSGRCITGCLPGWMGNECSTLCDPGIYGVNCSNICGWCRNGESCDPTSGECPDNLCEPGWKGVLCSEGCEEYKYGYNCSEHCGKCAANQTCDPSNGTCSEGICFEGWFGPRCNRRSAATGSRILMKKLAIALAVFTGLFAFTLIVLLAVMLLIGKNRSRRHIVTQNEEVPENDDRQELITTPTKHKLITISDMVVGVTDRKLGTGYFGEIWKARSLSNRDSTTEVALLIVRDGLSDDERADLKEAMVIAETLGRHPNILSLVLDAWTEDRYYIAMDYAESGDLKSYLQRMRKGSDRESNILIFFQVKLLYIAAEIACGLVYLAEKQIVHGNLAAEYIFLDEILRAKIGGFGLTRPAKFKDGHRWMALESLKTDNFTVESDLWSYGVILWEIVTIGGDPFGDKEKSELLEILQEEKRLEIPGHCNPELSSLIKNCWRDDPSERPGAALMHEKLLEMAREGEMYMKPKDITRS